MSKYDAYEILSFEISLALFVSACVCTLILLRVRNAASDAAVSTRVSSARKYFCLSYFLRSVWLSFNISGWLQATGECRDPHIILSTTSRVAQLLHFVAWSGVCASLYADATALFSANGLYLLANFWIWLGMTALLLVQYSSCDSAADVYEAETVFCGACFALLALGMAHAMVFKVRKCDSLLTAAAILFAVRSALWLYRPIFNEKFENLAGRVVYPWFFITIPELVPSVWLTYRTRSIGAWRRAVLPSVITPLLGEQQQRSLAWL